MQAGQLHRRYWTYYSEVELAMSQGKLANWTSGGEKSLSLLSNIRYFWNYNRNNTSWENWVHYRFGFMKNGDEDIRKNEDRFELNSKLGSAGSGQETGCQFYEPGRFHPVIGS